jgi:hypothetical protein
MSSHSDYYVVLPLPLLTAPMAALRAYLTLRSYLNPADPGREVWPSRKHMADRAEVSIDTIDRGIKWLADEGWITVIERRDAAGDRTSNAYIVFGAKQGVAADLPRGVAADLRPQVAAEVVEEVEPREVEPTSGAALPPLPPMEGNTESFALKAPVESNRRSRATRMPDGFTPDPDLVAWTKENCPDIDAKYEWAQFVDHAAATDRRQVDWRKAWMTWARKAQQWKRERGQQQRAAQKRDMSALWIKQDFGNPLEGIAQ